MTDTSMPDADSGTSTRPYLIRALHEWCTDNGFTPYMAVYVDSSVRVPKEHVKNNEIVLNIGYEATTGLQLGNEWVEFRARFGGVSRDVSVPVDHVIAIYARENGQGVAFPMPTAPGVLRDDATPPDALGSASAAEAESQGSAEASPAPRASLHLASSDDDPTPTPPTSGGDRPRPALKRVK